MFRVFVLVAALFAAAVASAQDRPEDKRPHLSIYTHAQYRQISRESALVAAFANDPALANLVKNCHYHHYTERDPLYPGRAARTVPVDQFPAIVLQRPDGGYVYKATGQRCPNSAAKIVDEIKYFASLDPTARTPDSRLVSQSGIDGVPDIDGPPSDCPDGICPPQSGGLLGPLMPDSADQVNLGRTPVRDMTAAAVFIVAAVVGVGLFLVGGVLFLAVVYVVAKAIR